MTHVAELECELCIVGAGYAALNGLNAAAKYLKPGSRVVLIDKHQTWGGQWVKQYDFVRLHQPYRMFTAGDQQWALRKDPSHLATRREVLDHLASVPKVSAGHLEITPLFGHAYRGHRIRAAQAEVDAVPVANGGAGTRVRARRLLKATGTDIEMLPPFAISSPRVRSVGVSDPVLMSREFLDSDAPVYVIGSGKTAMDTVRHLAQSSAGRRRSINIIIGSGMWFFSRDRLYPTGRARMIQGTLTGDMFLRMCERFDGQNELDVMQDLARSKLVVDMFGEGGNCRYGIISDAERDEVLRALDQVHRGHLVDVDGTEMVLRVGQERRSVAIPDGSWFINCTSHLRWFPHEPVLQDSGIVCAPQFALGFTGNSAYFLTHAWYRGVLGAIAPELYRFRLDVQPKLRLAPHLAVMAMANLALVTQHVPRSVPANFQGDFSKWYPLYRQLPMIARVLASRSKLLRKAERTLGLRFSDSVDA